MDAKEAVAQVLGDHELFACTRVWEAWQHKTMSQDDFVHAEDDTELVESVLEDLLGLGFVFVGKTPDKGVQYGCRDEEGVTKYEDAYRARIGAQVLHTELVRRDAIYGPWRPAEEG